MTAPQLPADLPASAEAAASRTAARSLVGLLMRFGSLAGFLLVLLYFSLAARGFLSVFNITLVIEQSAILGILAFGMAIVIIGGGSDVINGGIDLSLAANMGLSSAVYAVSINAGQGELAALALALGTGLLIGLVNAVAVVWLGILPLLATLAVMNVIGGAELVLTENTVIPASSWLLSTIAGEGPFGLSMLAWVLLLLAAVLTLLVQYSPFGLRLYAVGGHREAARAAGLRVRAYIAGTYLISGLCGGLAGVVYAARLSGSTPGANELLLSVVVAALLGVVFSRRLVPTVVGTLLSVLFVGFLVNGFQLLNVSSYWVNGVMGALILLVVAVTSLLRRGEG